MANISDAYGKMYLEGDWNENDIYNLACILLPRQDAVYNTSFNLLCDKPLSKETLQTMVKLLLSGEQLEFFGTGRWTFECNLECLHDWSIMKDYSRKDIEKFLDPEKYMEIRQALFESMYNKNLKIFWDFIDLEPGWGVLYKQLGSHYVNEEKILTYEKVSGTSYECNLKNYCLVFCEGDTYRLSEQVLNILKALKIDSKLWIDKVCELITKHESWYDLEEGVEYDKDEIPEALIKDIQVMVNGTNL